MRERRKQTGPLGKQGELWSRAGLPAGPRPSHSSKTIHMSLAEFGIAIREDKKFLEKKKVHKERWRLIKIGKSKL